MPQPISMTQQPWSRSAFILATLIAGQTTLAVLVATHPALRSSAILMLMTLSGIVSIVLIVAVTMPIRAKMGLIGIGAVAMMGAVLGSDPFGLRATERLVANVATDRTIVPPPPTMPQEAKAVQRHLTIDTSGDPRAASFASDLSGQVGQQAGGNPAPPDIDALIDVDEAAGGLSYAMAWSVRRGIDHLWCGQLLSESQPRDRALAQFGEHLVDTLMLPADQPLRCA
jgi:hypothetical protein